MVTDKSFLKLDKEKKHGPVRWKHALLPNMKKESNGKKNFKTLTWTDGEVKERAELTVFPEGVVAFCTTQELSGGFICASGLHLPNISGIVATFGTFNPDGWKRPQFLFFLAYYGDELLRTVLNDFPHFWGFNLLACLLFISVFGADKNQ